MPATPTDLAARYRCEPDEAILAAFRTGKGGYTPEAWEVITAEAARRGLPTDSTQEADPLISQAEADEQRLPTWLSGTLLSLAVLFLILQVFLTTAFHNLIEQDHAYFGSTGTLVLGLIAWKATRFVHGGPHAAFARWLGFAALAFTALALLLRLA